MHRHAYFEILLIANGGGTQQIDFNKHDLTSNSCFIVFPGQVHLVNCSESDTGWVTQFSQEWLSEDIMMRLKRTFKFGLVSPLVFREEQQKYAIIESVLNLIKHTLVENSDQFQRLQLESLLELVLSSAQEQNPLPSGHSKTIEHFLSALEVHFHEQHELQFYANLCGTQPKKLSSLCKTHLGFTGLNIIHNRILIEVKRKLLTGNENFSEIGYSLGFNSHSSFNNFIKRKTKLNLKDLKLELEKS